ncbi:MAG TPA: GDSL-type esterase/lipase family protein [Thermoanaerobaculia bacterium]|jgi:lysophospholipase L1-like esterase
MSSPKGRVPSRFVINSFLLLGSMLFALVLCEVGARLLLPPQQTIQAVEAPPPSAQPYSRLDTQQEKSIDSVVLFGGSRGVRLRPNTRGQILNHSLSQRDVLIEVNSIGLRYPELPPKTSDEFRVLVLGDSITLGDFVPEDETLTGQLEKRTAGRSRKIRFVNAGLPGAGSAEERYLYEEVRDAVQPDLVLLAMYLNDAQTAHSFYARAIPAPYSKSRFLTWAANRVQLIGKSLFREEGVEIDPRWRERFRAGRELKSGDMFESKDGFDFEIYNAYMDFGLAWNPQSWEILDNIVASLQTETRAKGTALAIVLFPVHIQVLGSYEDHRPQDRCRAMCARRGIPYVDPLSELRADWKSKREKLFYDHCHYTPYGYEVVARAVLSGLDREKLVPN